MAMKEDDYIQYLYVAESRYLDVLYRRGTYVRIKVYRLPMVGRTARGKPLNNFHPIQPDEKLSAVLPVSTFDADRFVVMTTRRE